MEDGQLKLSSVISDIHGVSGPDMLEAIAPCLRQAEQLDEIDGVPWTGI